MGISGGSPVSNRSQRQTHRETEIFSPCGPLPLILSLPEGKKTPGPPPSPPLIPLPSSGRSTHQLRALYSSLRLQPFFSSSDPLHNVGMRWYSRARSSTRWLCDIEYSVPFEEAGFWAHSLRRHMESALCRNQKRWKPASCPD